MPPARTGSVPAAPASVYERIKAMILSNTIPPGGKLNIDQLARELGVSQTPVREAIQRLEGDKLVVRLARGYSTTQLLGEAELRHMFEVRLLLEPWCARAAAVDRAGNPGRAMLQEVDRFLREGGDGDARQLISVHDSRFHELVLDAVGNPFLTDAFRQMHPHLHLFRLYPADVDGERTIEEHRRLALAIADADPDEAERAMRSHLLHAMERFSVGVDGKVPSFADVRPGPVRPERPA
jgi:DNA-binding GntR family transcriptional regulator